MALRMLCSKTTNFNRILPVNSTNQLPKQLQNVTPTTVRWYSFRSSEPVGDVAQFPEVEVVKNPPEWKYVERLLAPRTVPKPIAKETYPSGWKPANPRPELKYVVLRTKNHMLPVYIRRAFRGQRRITAIRHVEGDIWQLEAELRYLIEKQLNRPIITRVNEMSGLIELKGDHVAFVEKFLLDKGM
ncbi:probable 39S ribosomal protein L49, mitochondrial [Anopheles marshallii]|uniref:probable 39S ribosomal protein L49, mitochondrial n=1 Tax=Anopheles marshallii TaxID=1521116 RepID=UPI00237A79C7|nr:probable 39S ribosomal protein L49, mitochondrial [Anopheles marshallii]